MKQFTIIFDKKQEEYAAILNTLVSEVKEAKNVERAFKVYKQSMPLTDKDCVLFVGNEASQKYRDNFKDKYSKYGIHVGYRGTKAWIFCEKTKWNKNTYKEFHGELLNLYKKLDMNSSKVQDFVDAGIEEYISTGASTVPVSATLAQQVIWKNLVTSKIATTLIQNPFLWIYNKVSQWTKVLFANSARIDQQYRFAIVLFFSEYLKDYLNITFTNNNE